MSDHIITSKIANALMPKAQPSRDLVSSMNWELLGLAGPLFQGLRHMQGGLWVGGRLTVFDDRLRFAPNALNQAVHDGDVSLEIPFDAVTNVKWRPGVLTSIVDVMHGGARSSFRCFGSKVLAQAIQTAVAARRS